MDVISVTYLTKLDYLSRQYAPGSVRNGVGNRPCVRCVAAYVQFVLLDEQRIAPRFFTIMSS